MSGARTQVPQDQNLRPRPAHLHPNASKCPKSTPSHWRKKNLPTPQLLRKRRTKDSPLVKVTSADARSSKLASRSAASSPDALIAATDYLARGAFGDCAALTAAAFSVISPLGGSGIVKQRYKGPALSTGCHWQQRQRTEQLTEITV
ncbi:hypothetical protein MRX96_000133 [Rhipicephalus microplus]